MLSHVLRPVITGLGMRFVFRILSYTTVLAVNQCTKYYKSLHTSNLRLHCPFSFSCACVHTHTLECLYLLMISFLLDHCILVPHIIRKHHFCAYHTVFWQHMLVLPQGVWLVYSIFIFIKLLFFFICLGTIKTWLEKEIHNYVTCLAGLS